MHHHRSPAPLHRDPVVTAGTLPGPLLAGTERTMRTAVLGETPHRGHRGPFVGSQDRVLARTGVHAAAWQAFPARALSVNSRAGPTVTRPGDISPQRARRVPKVVTESTPRGDLMEICTSRDMTRNLACDVLYLRHAAA